MYKINVPPPANIRKVSIFYFREGGGSIFSPLNYKNLHTLQVLERGSGHITLILQHSITYDILLFYINLLLNKNKNKIKFLFYIVSLYYSFR